MNKFKEAVKVFKDKYRDFNLYNLKSMYTISIEREDYEKAEAFKYLIEKKEKELLDKIDKFTPSSQKEIYTKDFKGEGYVVINENKYKYYLEDLDKYSNSELLEYVKFAMTQKNYEKVKACKDLLLRRKIK